MNLYFASRKAAMTQRVSRVSAPQPNKPNLISPTTNESIMSNRTPVGSSIFSPVIWRAKGP